MLRTPAAPARAPTRIIAAGIARVVAAMEDPFPLVSGRGFASLRAHGIEVEVGVERDAALRLNQPFLTARARRPAVRHPEGGGEPDGLHRRGARRAHAADVGGGACGTRSITRARVDAIGVGSETVLVDDPLLTARDVYRERPLARVIFDRRLRTPPRRACSRRSPPDR